jgi:curved DNA-binding protein CbpA
MEINARFNYYDILELSPQCNQSEVTESYLRAKSTYSSNNPALYTIFSQTEAREYMNLIEEAYSILGNRTLRSLYDEKIAHGVKDAIQVSYTTLLEQSRTSKAMPLPKTARFKPEYEKNQTTEDEIKSRLDWDGVALKAIREYKKVSLEDLSAVTKITSFYIKAIEGMELKNLPAPVFIRGYIIQICRVLGLDDRKVPDAYMKIFRDRTSAPKTL